MAVADGVENSLFLKQLTSSDISTRKEALTTLSLYLQRDSIFNPLELLKLWKGLFYCMWMTANPKPQQRLAEDYASLVTNTLAPHNVMPFVDAFWQTMSREWAGIDALRMDKYLRLARLMLRATFKFLGSRRLQKTLVEEHNNILERTPLNAENPEIPNGLRYHTLDIFVDELQALEDSMGDSMKAENSQTLLRPIEFLKENGQDRTVRKRAAQTLEDDRLEEFGITESEKARSNETGEVEDDEFNGFD